MRSWPPRLQQYRQELSMAAAATELPPELVACGLLRVKAPTSPEVLAAIMDRESLAGLYLKPRGPKGYGDGKWGHGLMQIDSRSWPAFCNDPKLWQEPYLNILFGAGVLAKYQLKLGGDLPPAVAAYNCGPNRVERLCLMYGTPSIAQLDQLTTGKNYVSDVLARLHRLQFGGEA